MEQFESIPVRAAFSVTMKALERLSRTGSPTERAAIQRAMATLRTSLPRAEQEPPEQDPPTALEQLHLAAGIVEPPSGEAAALRAWGADLVERRKAAGLSRTVLAERAGLSESTLRNVETGRRAPTRTTIMHLQSVPELRIDPTPIGDHIADRRRVHQDVSPNCWLTPEYDALKLHNEMTMLLNGRGGHLEQTYLYLDPSSAAAWYSIAEQEDYTVSRMLMPLDNVAECITERAGSVGLDVIGLGCGDGKDEVRLTQCLLERRRNRNLRLYLLDISQPLLCSAYRHAAEALADRATVSVYAIQGNFHNLGRYTSLLHSPERSHRRRVVCLFGNTFANLQNEILFVRNSLMGFAPGDFLMLTIGEALAPADKPDEILAKDRLLAGRTTETMSTGRSMQSRMFCDLLRRYIHGLKSTEITSVLDFAACPIPGSYAADIRATVKMTSGESKHFSIAYLKRHDQRLLNETMLREGWQAVAHWRMVKDYHPRRLLLYQRVR